MKIFSCPACAKPAYFRNAVCGCGAALVFDPDARRFLWLEEAAR